MPNYVAVRSEFTVNSLTSSWQDYPDFAKLTGGRFVAVWESPDDSSSDGVRGRIFGPDGLPIGPDFAINTATKDDQRYPSVSGLPDGGFVVTWWTRDALQDGNSDAIKAQRFDSSGAKVGPEFLVNTLVTNIQWQPAVAGLDNGGFVITWETYDGAPDDWGRAIKAQMYNAAGAKVGGEFMVNTITSDTQAAPEISALPGGGFVAVWTSQVSGQMEVRAQVFDSAGAKSGGEIFVNTQTVQSQTEMQVATLADGGFVVTWTTFDTTQDGSGYAIKAQLFNSAGAKVGGEFLVNTATASSQHKPNVTGLSNGDFVIAWRTDDQTADDSSGAIKAQVFSSTGTKIGGEFRVNSVASSTESDPHIVDLGNGAFMIGWTSYTSPTGDYNIKGQIYSSGSTPVIRSNGGGDSAALLLAEQEAAVTTVQAYDIDTASLVYSLAGGADAALFSINASTGALTFLAAPEFDTPADSDGNNVYEVVVRASDGERSDTQALSVTIASPSSVPVIVSDGGGDQGALTVLENTTHVTNVAAADGEGDVMSYSIVGGADAGRFTINAATGALSFVTAPNREAPTDADADNVYQVVVRASDGVLSDRQTLAITVANVNEAPVITRFGTPTSDSIISSMFEGSALFSTFTATDAEGDALSWSLSGADAALFTFNTANGQLRFNFTPDYEAPASSAGTNSYYVTLGVSDGSLADSLAITIHIGNLNEAPVILSGGGGATAAVTADENQTAVTTVVASDPEKAALTYSIAGGADAARFAINASTGVLSFVQALNFEAPQDAGSNNVYDVVVSVSDGSRTDTQVIAVTLANVNEAAPVITGSESSFLHIENRTSVASFSATDADGTSVTWSIAGGADAARFEIDAATGALRFITAPDFESPGDAGGDNLYDVTIAAGDGSLSATRALTIEVLNWNEGPVIVSGGGGDSAALAVAENVHFVTTVAADDPDARDSSYTFSIAGGADAALFIIHAQTGQLFFRNNAGGNFEGPADSGGDNVYDVIVSVSDGFEPADTQALAITVTNADDAPVITSDGGGGAAAVSVTENSLAVTNVAATDPEGKALSYAISGGADASRFLIDSATGALSFLMSPDFEQPTDLDGDNVYDVTVTASDGTGSDSQALSITVGNANERPMIVSNGGGTSAFVQIDEGQTAVATVAATDPDGAGAVTYSIGGGAHADLFVIDSATGALSFAAAPDYEVPLGESNNFYSVTVFASDGELSSFQSVQVGVRNVNEGVAITSGAAPSVVENSTAVMTVMAQDLDGDSVSFAISGGADSALFAVDAATGELSFLTAPNFEAPADSDGDNVYEVEVTASDGSLSASRTVSVTVTDQGEPIAFVSGGGGDQAAIGIDENSGNVLALLAVDPDGAAPHYGIAGGADAALFEIDPLTRALRFRSLPDFENPGDADGDNVYEVVVAATDGQSFDYQAVSVTVGNVYEGVSFGSPSAEFPVAENSSGAGSVAAVSGDRKALTYAIAGGADAALFSIDPATGALSFVTAADYEAPGDAQGSNAYSLVVSASDGTSSASQNVTVLVADVDEAPRFQSYGGSAAAAVTVAERGSAVGTVAAADPDASSSVAFAIAGGADAALFEVDAESGALRFRQEPDFEAPADSDGDNVYHVTVAAHSGALSATQSLSITVANVNENVAITSNGAGGSAGIAVAENGTAVTIVAAATGFGTLTYSIVGGADAADFTIDAATGALAFAVAPNFEGTGDSDHDNVYEVTVRASNGVNSDEQNLSVGVTDVDETPYFFDLEEGAVEAWVTENGAFVGEMKAFDPDSGPAITYAITGGADSASFVIDPNTGSLSFRPGQWPDFEASADAGGDNVYDLEITASQGAWSRARAFTVTVVDENEVPVITSNGGGTSGSVQLNEGERSVATVLAQDPEGTPLTYSIVGGADASLFAIDAATGILTLIDAPDYEAPADGGADNLYNVIVSASDGERFAYQGLQVTINDVNEGVTITTGPALSMNEDTAFVTRVAAIDGDGDALSFAIVGGVDASHFVIDPETGNLSLRTSLDYEAPADADGDNVYHVTVRATDGQLSDERQMSVTVNDVYDHIEIVSFGGAESVSLTMQELTSFQVAQVEASMSSIHGVTFAIAGGADASLFTINPSDGKLSFNYPFMPDFEAPADADGDNVYDVVVVATHRTTTDTQAYAITITNRNESLWITSDGHGDANLSVSEGGRHVTTVTAYDPDGDVPSYSILGGPDAAKFAIDSATGVLTFIAAPDYEAPLSAAGTNVYLLEVGAGDGEYLSRQKIRVEVANVNEGVTITSGGGGAGASVTANENGLAVTTVAASDADGDLLTYSIAGGADSGRFTIDARTGALRFVEAPNFEAPADSGGNNVYDVVVSVTDGTFTDTQAIAVTVANVNEGVAITSGGGGAGASVTVAENANAVATVAATDQDGGPVTYAIAGGADAARFTINAATGALAFIAAPNFEAPADSGANNVYDVIVSASDGTFTDTQAIAVTVSNVNEGVAITSSGGGASATLSVAENGAAVATVTAADIDGGPVTYAIAGGADSGRFTINATTGVLTFIAAPNFEAPTDAGGNNVYDVIVSATDGSFTDTQALAVSVGNVNEGIAIMSNGGGAGAAVSVAENGRSVATVIAADPDGTPATYSIVGGADAARFTIDPQTGLLQFVAAPDHELPGDSNGDNVYDVVVRASDGQLSDDQALSVTVTNVKDGATITGTSGSDTISGSSFSSALRTTSSEDTVFGRDGHDNIQGMAGDDDLYGEGGNDTLTGGAGADRLTGGLGKDTFTYNSASESVGAARDLIMDFSRAQGDKISLSAIDANSLVSSNQAFTFIGSAAFSNVAGQLRFETSGGVTTISGDVNGDGVADLQIQLSGSIALIASDFIL